MKKQLKRIGIILTILLLTLAVTALWGKYWLQGYQEDISTANLLIPMPAQIPPPLLSGTTDWPRWKGPTTDNHSLVQDIRTNWSGGLKKLWEVEYLCQDASSVAWSCPTLSGNRLIVQGRDNTQDHVYALDPNTGFLIWHQAFASDSGDDAYGEGPRSAPLIEDESVYTVTRGGDVSCWSLADGQLRWQKHLVDLGGKRPTWGYSASPVTYNEKLLLPAGGQTLLIALDKNTGDMLWKSPPAPCSYSTPVIAHLQGRDQIVYLGGQALFGIDPNNGATLWQTPWATRGNLNICTPIVEGNTIAISAWYGMGMKVVNITDNGPEVLWQGKQMQNHLADSFILNDHLYGYSGMSSHNKGHFKCLNLQTGQETWSTQAIGTGSFIYTAPYFLNLDIKGNLYLVEPNAKSFKLITQFPNAIDNVKHRTWTHPILANDRLYLRFAHRLICYEIKQQHAALHSGGFSFAH